MIWRTLKWLVTPQRRRLSEISDEARGSGTHEEPELGFEGLDLDEVARVHRRNAALERSSFLFSRRGGRSSIFGGISTADTAARTKFKDDDPDYARKFHQTFQQGKSTR